MKTELYCRSVAKWISLIALVSSLYAGPAQAQTGPKDLFTSLPSQAQARAYGFRAIQGDFDAQALGAKNLRLQLPNGKSTDLAQSDLQRRGAGDLVWIGKVSGSDDSEVVLTLKHGFVFGRIRDGKDVYEVRTGKNKRLIIEELNQAAFPQNHNDAVAPDQLSNNGSQNPAPAIQGDGAVVIDIMSVYSNSALAKAGSAGQMLATIQAAIDTANAAFANSNIAIQYNLVHVAHVNYNGNGSIGNALSFVQSDPGVAALRDQYGADMVSIIVDTPNSCGQGYVQRDPGPGFADYAFQATDIDCAVGNLTFAHEHGHNLGLEHNPENSGTNAAGASYPWSFGHYVDGSYRTVMSYSELCQNGCARAQYFSNPNVSHQDAATGVANARDNAQSANSIAQIVAGFRQAASAQDTVTVFAAIGDFGNGSTAESEVASRISGWGVNAVVTVGDNRYGSISFETAVGQYFCAFLTDINGSGTCPTGTSTTNAFFPAPGNHDYTDGGGITEFTNYFTLPGTGVTSSNTSGSERYYDFVRGPVHFFAIDSHGALTSASSMAAQKAWLEAQMAASSAPWQVVLTHHAPFSSASTHGSNSQMQWPFAAWAADAVIGGHDHTYERLQIGGIPYFVNGLGGRSIRGFGTPETGSLVRYNGDYGAMRISADGANMTFEFVTRTGTVVDNHSIQQNGFVIVESRVNSGADDVEQKLGDGFMYSTSSDLELGDDPAHNGDQTIGLRFNNLNIPQGATITAAYVSFTVDVADSVATNVTILAENSDNAAAFSATAFDLTTRPTTGASVNWNIPAWTTVGASHNSPDISSVIQEVVNRGGWAAGNSMVLVIPGTGHREAESYEGLSAAAPLLHIEYTTNTNPNVPPTANFSYAATGLNVIFTDTSSDSDGTIVSRSWDFGDGANSTATNPSHGYATSGSYSVTLTVTDGDGATGAITQTVAVTAPNVPPTSNFGYAATGLDVNFTDNSSDSDGSIVSRSWDLGDGGSSTATNPSHSYAAGGSYTVTLTVTDDDGATGVSSQTVTVTAPSTTPAAPTNLSASVQNSGKGRNKIKTVTLNWTDNANNETEFAIERCQQTGKGKNKVCNFAAIATVGANVTSFNETAGTGTFKYRVRARNGSGDSGYSNVVKI